MNIFFDRKRKERLDMELDYLLCYREFHALTKTDTLT